jgi:hypothetical protein
VLVATISTTFESAISTPSTTSLMRASREKPSPCCLPTETTLLDTLAPRVVERGPTGASVLATSTYTIAFPPKANPISSAAAPERPSCIPPPNGYRSFTRTTTDAPRG